MAEVDPPEVRCVDPAGAVLGEGPVWVQDEQALYWVDIRGRRVHRYHPETGAATSWPTPYRIGASAPRTSGGFIAAGEHGFLTIDAQFENFDLIGDPEPHLPGNRSNDGKVDLQGRFWTGTMDDAEEEPTGALYRIDPDLSWRCEDTDYAVTNGPAFSPDGRYLYHNDSGRQVTYRFTLDQRTGGLLDKQVFARFEEGQGYPDGMTTDSEGCLWIAFWDGWCLRRLSPEGQVIQTIRMPVQRPTSCVFAGEKLDRLFVTSASFGIASDELQQQPQAGGLFVVLPGVAGFPTPSFAG
jgi:D-xylonolactonase